MNDTDCLNSVCSECDDSPTNFSIVRYSMIFSPDDKWGNPQSDGTVTGMIGAVYRREAHVAIDIISITGNFLYINRNE